MHVRATSLSDPRLAGGAVSDTLMHCVEACFGCAQACISCADACLSEEGAAGLGHCIRLNLDCADACAATGPMLTRHTHASPALIRRMIETCAELCRACADECDRHAQEHEHCRLCADACRDCERALREAALSFSATPLDASRH